jgi:RNA polymerase sigma factor (sigma-70 family)
MKTINSKKIQVLCDEDGNPNGFVGTVQVYDKNIYVDTRDGTGYDKVIKNLESLIYRLALKYTFNGNSLDDTKHDIIVHILEGIAKYDPNKKMKLSSFLQMRVDRRLINDIRNRNRGYKNATFLNIINYNITCSCGCIFSVTVNKGDKYTVCPYCSKQVVCDSKNNAVNIFEVNESMLEQGSIDNNSYVGDFGTHKNMFYDDVINQKDIEKWLLNEDPRVAKIVELIYFYDYSVSSAAEQVGLTSAGAHLKLKNLQRKKVVREIFNR